MMTFPKIFVVGALLLFGVIAAVGYFKQDSRPAVLAYAPQQKPIEVALGKETRIAVAPQKPIPEKQSLNPQQTPVKNPPKADAPAKSEPQKVPQEHKVAAEPPKNSTELPEVNLVDLFFNKDGPTFPIVETITYKSRVSWQKGRPAWLSDYAGHYHTSRHFIARSLNGKPDYMKQDLAEGARFNVLRLDKNIQFYLLVDISRCRMWFYYDDLTARERVLVKTYKVGIGRVDGAQVSGCLTPLGKYTLGNKTAIYKPKTMGSYQGKNIEMITIFGTRWIPFDKEVENCSSPAKGLGIHGVPWVSDGSGSASQDCSSLGKHQSDGCVRMASEDIEELFAIIITKPTTIELVKDFFDSRVPANMTIKTYP